MSVRLSLWAGVLVAAGLFGWGAWQRRWIADDGLIVLRTVRNLMAGNGPVFNAGERVEANTSTVWTYLMYLGGWVGGPVRLEYVALTLALMLSVLGVVLLMLGAARLYAPSLQGRRRSAAAGRGARLHRGTAGPRLRDIRPGERPGPGLPRAAVVDAGVLVAEPADGRVAWRERAQRCGARIHRRVGVRRRPQRPGAT